MKEDRLGSLYEIAKVCYNVAGIHERKRNFEDADEMYRGSIEIYEELAEKELNRVADQLIKVYGDYSRFCEFSGNFRNAEKYSLKKAELLERLEKKNADKYLSELMRAYASYANYLGVTAGKKDEGVEYYLRADKIAMRLAEREPEVYNPLIAYYNWFMYIFSKEEVYSEKAIAYARLCPKNQKSRLVFSYFAIEP